MRPVPSARAPGGHSFVADPITCDPVTGVIASLKGSTDASVSGDARCTSNSGGSLNAVCALALVGEPRSGGTRELRNATLR